MTTAAPAITVRVTRFEDRFAHCTTCHAAARWMVEGTVACGTHVDLWAAWHVERLTADRS